MQLGAIRDALDRVGLTGKSTVEVEHTLKPYERLIANIRGVRTGITRDESRARRGLPPVERPAEPPVLDAEVVEDGADLAQERLAPPSRQRAARDIAPSSYDAQKPPPITGMAAIEEAARANRQAGVWSGKKKRRR